RCKRTVESGATPPSRSWSSASATRKFGGGRMPRFGRIARMRPVPGELLHFSEDPAIAVFRPHVAATARQRDAHVWAVDAQHAPSYWFPRQCPRAMAWIGPGTTAGDRERIFGATAAGRVHVIEYAWLSALATTTVYAYRFDAAPFRQL